MAKMRRQFDFFLFLINVCYPLFRGKRRYLNE
nr:MAG TPA: hypothetical protein [Caudoviricetes sp.]